MNTKALKIAAFKMGRIRKSEKATAMSDKTVAKNYGAAAVAYYRLGEKARTHAKA